MADRNLQNLYFFCKNFSILLRFEKKVYFFVFSMNSIKFPSIWYISHYILCTIALCVEMKRAFVNFSKILQHRSRKNVCPYECVCCCWIYALALLTKFGNVECFVNDLNLPILCSFFFQILEISHNLATSEKMLFFFVETYEKAEYCPKPIYICSDMLALCLCRLVLQKMIQRISKSYNFG